MPIHHLLYACALVCFVIAALGVNTGRLNLTAAGLACWVATFLV